MRPSMSLALTPILLMAALCPACSPPGGASAQPTAKKSVAPIPQANTFLVDGKPAPLSGEITATADQGQGGDKYISIKSSGDKTDTAYTFWWTLKGEKIPKGFKGEIDPKNDSVSSGFWKGDTKFVAKEEDYDVKLIITDASSKISGSIRAHNLHSSKESDKKIDIDITFSVPTPN